MPYLILQRKLGSGGPLPGAVQLPGGTVNALVIGGIGDAQCGIIFHADGTVTTPLATSSTPNPIDDWWTTAPEAGVGSDYEIRATLLSGATPDVGTMNTWLNPSGDPTTRWAVNSSSGTVSSEIQFEIRDVATQTTQATGTYTLNATKS